MAKLRLKQFDSVLTGSLNVSGSLGVSGSALTIDGKGSVSGSALSSGSFGRLNSYTLDIDSIQGNWTNAGNTVADLGVVTTVDINGGTIDGSDVTVGAGKTLDVSGGTLTLANDQISGDNIQGGTIGSTTITTLDGTTIKDFNTISGSATSTGSFGLLQGDGKEITNLPVTALNNATENELVTVGSTTTELDAEANLTFASGKLEISGVTYPNLRVVGSQLGYLMVGDTGATSNFQNYQLVSDGGNFEVRRVNDAVSLVLATPFKISSDKVEVLNISGSATSTGSFGELHIGDRIGIGTTNPTKELHVVGDALVTGILTAQEFHTEFVSASIQYTSGSTKFGDTTDDLHSITGSLVITGSSLTIDSVGGVSGSSTSTGSFGYLQIQPDTDTGFAKIGRTFIGTTHSDHAGFSHVDQALSSGGYALVQFSTGITALNAASGQSTRFNINNSEIARLDATGLGIGNTSPGEKLDVTGNIKVSGNISGSATSTGSFGRVSTAGDIYSEGRIFESGTSVIDHATAMAIVFGG